MSNGENEFDDEEPPTMPSTPAARRSSVPSMMAVTVPPAPKVPTLEVESSPDTERDGPNLERVDARVFVADEDGSIDVVFDGPCTD